jgi:hypothetical protein
MSDSERPLVPVSLMGYRNSTVRKPVARTRVSWSYVVPFSSSMPVSVMRRILLVSRVVLGEERAG